MTGKCTYQYQYWENKSKRKPRLAKRMRLLSALTTALLVTRAVTDEITHDLSVASELVNEISSTSVEERDLTKSVDVVAFSDFRGNLGPAASILRGGFDGYHDRWQCAAVGDMTGKPVEGEHWLQVDLGAQHEVTRLDILQEFAHAKLYIIEARANAFGEWRPLREVRLTVRDGPIAESDDPAMCTVTGSGSKIRHQLTVDPRLVENARGVRYVRMRVRSCSPSYSDVRSAEDGCANKYCWSVWRMKIFGY